MLGLLHVGFSVPLRRYEYGEKDYGYVDRLEFYFMIADGWKDSDLLRVSGVGWLEERECQVGQDKIGNVLRKRESELRQEIARKAFNMLCHNFFKEELAVNERDRDDTFGNRWVRKDEFSRLFLIILNFFRAEEGEFRGVYIRNLTRGGRETTHHEKVGVEFLLKLIAFIWEWEDEVFSWDFQKKERRNTLLQATIDKAKPWSIEVLAHLGELTFLRKWLLDFDKGSLEKLKEIAMRNTLRSCDHHSVRKDRPVKTLDEARYLGSPSAWLLAEYELKMKEDKRLRAILRAEEKQEESAREIKKLTAKE